MEPTAVVRAKVQVQEVKQTNWQPNAREITARCVHSSDIEEDKRFSEATPSGSITLFVNNPAAIEKLPLGKQFYVDFIPAD